MQLHGSLCQTVETNMVTVFRPKGLSTSGVRQSGVSCACKRYKASCTKSLATHASGERRHQLQIKPDASKKVLLCKRWR